MSWLRKYLAGFRLALSRELIYRANFIFGRLREFLVFAALLYLYSAVPQGVGAYDSSHLLTYTLAAAFVSSLIFVYGMGAMASEITEGDLTNYLLRPVNYFGFWASRLAASRALLLIAGVLEVAVLVAIFSEAPFFWQQNIGVIGSAVILLLGAIVMVQLLDFIGGILAFWTQRAYGSRWLITVLIQFLSGAYLPIDLLPSWAQQFLTITPFPSLIYSPVKAYLGDLAGASIRQALFTQLAWIMVLGILLAILWRRGIKSYEAYGR